MNNDLSGPESPHFTIDTGAIDIALPAQEFPAWEEVDTGRFMPRRVRGSFQGRALG